jgi:hypothetical protein
MSCARWLSAIALLLAVGCSESPRDFTEGTLENAESPGRRTVASGDQSTDAPVVLVGAEGMTATPTDAGLEEPPAQAPPQDAGVVEQPATDGDREPDDSNGTSGDSHDAGSMMEPAPPPDDDDNGGLVGTVCDLLGGLLCPVGLLCVDGLCQQPE